MNIKKQLNNSWHHHELASTAKYKDEMEFKSKKQHRVSLPFYFASLATVLILCAIAIPVTMYLTKASYNSRTDFLSQSVEAKYNPDFGIVSYNEPYFNINYLGNVRYGVNEIDKGIFGRWINSQNIELSKKTFPEDQLNLAIANAHKLTVLYGNDYYELYFTAQDLLIIGCNNLYYVYDLPLADLLFEDFIS